MLLSPYTRRADLVAASSTTVNFASTGLAGRPIKLGARSGRMASVAAAISAVTISGSAGTKYVYAALAAPSGTPWGGTGGFIDRILQAVDPNRADWATALKLLFSDDGSLAYAAQNSTVTLVMSTTAPESETDTHRIPLGQLEWDGAAITSLISYESQNAGSISAGLHGQCILVKDGADLRLKPFGGTSIVIDGTPRAIAAAGVTLAATSLTPGTTYFIYAAWSGSAVTIEASTTGHALHTNGIEIKSADSTRSLVGMARCITGPAWSANPALVLSWFNRQPKAATTGVFTADRTTVSVTFAEINTEIRTEGLTWGTGAAMTARAVGQVNQSADTNQVWMAIGWDGTTAEDGGTSFTRQGGTQDVPFAVLAGEHLAEGYHYATLLGRVSTGTGTWRGSATAGERVSLHVMVFG